MKIAFQGVSGAYSEMALYSYFGRDCDAIGCKSFDEVFKAVSSDTCKKAIVPVENSTAGSIVSVLDLFLQQEMWVEAEVFLPVQHQLLAMKDTNIADIQKVYSHPQALAQCAPFLHELGLDIQAEFDTAGAAKMIRDSGSEKAAAIASVLAADIYDLKILKKNIQATDHNTTRFFVFAKKDNKAKQAKTEKTSMVFQTDHSPGALSRSLNLFSKLNLNLSKLESRPLQKKAWKYYFFVDVEVGWDELNNLGFFKAFETETAMYKVLGSYLKGD